MRTGVGPRAPFPSSSRDDTSPYEARPRGPSESLRGGATTFQRLRPGLANFSEFLLCASRRLRAVRARAGRPKSVRWGPSAPPWGRTASAPPVPCLRSLGLAPVLPRARTPRPAGPARIRMQRFLKAQLETPRSGAASGWGGRGASQARCQDRGFKERAEIPTFSWTRARLGSP